MDAEGLAARVNPVALRELGLLARSRRFLLLAVLGSLSLAVLLAMGLELYGAWAGMMLPFSRASAAGPSMPQLGALVAGGTWSLIGLAVLVVVPAYTFNSITGERASATLDQLLVSPLSPGDIARGKALAGLAVGLYLAAAALPVLAVGFALGGVSLADLVARGALTAAYAFLYAALGVASSSLSRQAWKAAALTAFAVLAVPSLVELPSTALSLGAAFGVVRIASEPGWAWPALAAALALAAVAALRPAWRGGVERAVVFTGVVALVLSPLAPSLRLGPLRLGSELLGVLSLSSLLYLALAVHGLVRQPRPLLALGLALPALAAGPLAALLVLASASLYLGAGELALSLAAGRLTARHAGLSGE